MAPSFDRARVLRCYEVARRRLLSERDQRGVWTGELSTSALSTATAIVALEMVRRETSAAIVPDELARLVAGGLKWLAGHQNEDGGWGDTVKSLSNISTTMLCHAAFHATQKIDLHATVVERAKAYIERSGGIAAVRARYGKDKTFSIPILTQCALAGLVEWREVAPLPFELACLPARFYKWVRLPVVSYALPALIAIGQARFHFEKPRNPLTRLIRKAAVRKSLAVLERIQPSSGGFLEATPLTSFVTMSLAALGRADHPVARKGVEFLIASVREDGSWPIDTNLATWVTTLAVNALGEELPADDVAPIRRWLLDQQYREVHPYTNADPGGWGWTDLPGGVPDADDTPGAMLALSGMPRFGDNDDSSALDQAATWLLDLQNRDGGWPTFCRGWGALPFDRSGADLTAHVLRALGSFVRQRGGAPAGGPAPTRVADRISTRARRSIDRGFQYLARVQRPDGSWLPLWFGNQHAADDVNPTYGTSRVLAAYRDTDQLGVIPFCKGLDWLRRAQNADGGWGGNRGVASSVEETALAAELLLSLETDPGTISQPSLRALEWLVERVDGETCRETWTEPSPIGFYFAKLWYFEKMYPMVFTVAALRRAAKLVK